MTSMASDRKQLLEAAAGPFASAARGEASSGSAVVANKLPKLIVPRMDERRSGPALPRRIFQRLSLLALISVSILCVAVASLYFQPVPVQWALSALGLQPGGGTATPIAIPASSGTAPAGTNAVPVAPERSDIVALGVLRPVNDVAVLAMPFGASDARIAQVTVAEGDLVQSGDILAVLDNAADLQAELAAAEAALAVRQAEFERARRDVISSRDEGQAALDAARVNLQNAETELARADQLVGRGAVSVASRDDAQAARDRAEREVAQLSATLARYNSLNLDAQPDIRVAAQQVAAAEADFRAAQADLEQSRVRAPFAGVVLKVNVRVGERPGDAGLFELADLTRMQAEIEIYQADIGRVQTGMPVQITSEAFQDTLTGIVQRIGLSVERQEVVDGSPAANTDARVIAVDVALDERSTAIAARYTNLQVTARIEGAEP